MSVFDEKFCLLEFTDGAKGDIRIKSLEKYYKTRTQKENHPILDQTTKQLAEYFDGKRKKFSLPLDTPGTVFQQQTRKTLQTILCSTSSIYK